MLGDLFNNFIASENIRHLNSLRILNFELE